MSTTKRQRWLGAVAVMLLAGLSVIGCSRSEADNPAAKVVPPLPIAVKTRPAEARALPSSWT